MIEDFALIDILLSDSFPKEVNKSKIKEIFEILQSQDSLDSIEIYNAKTERWETTGIKLKKEKSDFGFLSTNLAKIQNL